MCSECSAVCSLVGAGTFSCQCSFSSYQHPMTWHPMSSHWACLKTTSCCYSGLSCFCSSVDFKFLYIYSVSLCKHWLIVPVCHSFFFSFFFGCVLNFITQHISNFFQLWAFSKYFVELKHECIKVSTRLLVLCLRYRDD